MLTTEVAYRGTFPSLRKGTGEDSIRNHSNSTSLRAQFAGRIEKALSSLHVIKTTMSSEPVMSQTQTAKLQTRPRAGALTLLATLASTLLIDGAQAAGEAYCWGWGGSGRLGDGASTNRTVPTPVSTALVATWQAISAGGLHNCGLSSQGEAYCWGVGGAGQAATR